MQHDTESAEKAAEQLHKLVKVLQLQTVMGSDFEPGIWKF